MKQPKETPEEVYKKSLDILSQKHGYDDWIHAKNDGIAISELLDQLCEIYHSEHLAASLPSEEDRKGLLKSKRELFINQDGYLADSKLHRLIGFDEGFKAAIKLLTKDK